jgi:HK97 gp10 family phage protein
MAKGDFTIGFPNFAKFEAKLLSLGPKARDVLKDALKEGGLLIQSEARRNIHNVSGDLAKSLRVTATKGRGKVAAFVSTSSSSNLFTGKTFYGGFVEFGHKLGSRKLGAARRDIPAHPFLSTAVKSKRAQVQDVIAARLKAGMAAEGVY